MNPETKSIASSLLPEFDLEVANTRKVLERIPDADFAWKPHAKSFSMGELAGHVATIPGWLKATLEAPSFDVCPGGVPAESPKPASAREALTLLLEGAKAAREALAATSDEEFAADWSLLENGKPYFTMPRAAVVRSFVMNHLVHHRAQLGVYLRLRDVPVPGIYGPSADDQG
jgi:uncharacterized damage-inducible protein DinB